MAGEVKEAVRCIFGLCENFMLILRFSTDGSGGLGDSLKKQNWDPASLSKFEKNF